eukprot:TRINITY_DN814_c0_g2_i2.p1 TRINITY_DN814_c0_g2~~TRINITY_DN814_c0_g2_i2.p1  ORF type:complete len:191 (+),score=45.02 TRINITY_DN814_c0_g2_i2:132-704(+)
MSSVIETTQRQTEATVVVEQYAELLEKVNKLEKMVAILSREEKILKKICNMIDTGASQMSPKADGGDSGQEKLKAYVTYLTQHKTEMIDYCLKYFSELVSDFKIVGELSDQRLLHLKRKLYQFRTVLVESIIDTRSGSPTIPEAAKTADTSPSNLSSSLGGRSTVHEIDKLPSDVILEEEGRTQKRVKLD